MRRMKQAYKRRWIMLAALCVGTAGQWATCREEAALFGLRTAFSSVTLPINTAIRQFFFGGF